MHIIISPAKSLDFETKIRETKNRDIRFPEESKAIISEIVGYSPQKLMHLMKISSQLAQLNHQRFQLWQYPFDVKQVRAALFAFKGDVYTGLDAYSLSPDEVDFAHEKLRILSGLYGLLRPLDTIMPYRLEMSTKLKVNGHAHLYDFWGDKISTLLREDMDAQGSDVLVNLASSEYFKAIDKKVLGKRIVTPVFKDWKNGHYKIISFYAKKARGLMTRFIIQNRITNPDDLVAFNESGYYFKADLSKRDQPVFVREQEA